MARSKDNLLVLIDGDLVEANLITAAIPADSVGPAHKKHHYALSNGQNIVYGWTKAEAYKMLIDLANELGWIVLQPLNLPVPEGLRGHTKD